MGWAKKLPGKPTRVRREARRLTRARDRLPTPSCCKELWDKGYRQMGLAGRGDLGPAEWEQADRAARMARKAARDKDSVLRVAVAQGVAGVDSAAAAAVPAEVWGACFGNRPTACA